MNTKKLFKGCVLGLYGMATFALALVIDGSGQQVLPPSSLLLLDAAGSVVFEAPGQ